MKIRMKDVLEELSFMGFDEGSLEIVHFVLFDEGGFGGHDKTAFPRSSSLL